MDPEILKAAGVVIGLVVAAPLFYACLRAASFFGSMQTTVKSLGETVEHLSTTLETFTGKITDDLTDKESRISKVEVKVDNLEARMPERRAAS